MKKLDEFIRKFDRAPLYFFLVPLLGVFFFYYFLLGENSFFEIFDQLDERIVNNIVNAKHLFDGTKIFPEVFADGIPRGGLTVSSSAFILYRFMSPFQAFMSEFIISEICAFLGCYACIKKFSGSSIMAVIGGTALMWIDYRPTWGLSIVGSPIIIFAFSDLYEICQKTDPEKKTKRICADYFLILFYGFMSHIAWVGYVVCILLFFTDIILFVRSSFHKAPFKYISFYAGSALLVFAYLIMYRDLFLPLFLEDTYISHRTEFSDAAQYPFSYAWNLILYGDGFSIHTGQRFLILQISVILVIYGIRYKKSSKKIQKIYKTALFFFCFNLLIAVIYGFCGTALYFKIRNHLGVLKGFNFSRFFWLYPGTWFLCDALILLLPVIYHGEYPVQDEAVKYHFTKKWPLWMSWLLVFILILPAAWNIRQNSNWLLNKSQYKNNMGVGLISWKMFFDGDLMEEIGDYIGREKSSYRVASLGISPSVASVAGFYTIDGYSDNYSLEYKYRFRKIIEKELDKNEALKGYYDHWGSRVYLFTDQETADYGAKRYNRDFVYSNLELNTSVMLEMGCEYIFSAAPIQNAADLHIELQKVFDDEESFYRIYLYKILQSF